MVPSIFSPLDKQLWYVSMIWKKLSSWGAKSRTSYRTYLKLGETSELDAAQESLEAAAQERERIQSFSEAETSTQRFLEELVFFLNLISLFTLLLAGIGMMSTLGSYLRNCQKTIATFKTIGMNNRQIFRLYFSFVLLLSIIGIVLGVLGGIVVLQFLPELLSDFLPTDFTAELQFLPLFKGIVLGLFISLLFTALPLTELKDIKPVQVFRGLDNTLRQNNRLSYLLGGMIFVVLSIFILLEIGEIKIGLYFLLGSIGLFTLLFVLCVLIVRGLQKMSQGRTGKHKALPLQINLALKGMVRPGNSTPLIMTSLATALTILMTITLLESNIRG